MANVYLYNSDGNNISVVKYNNDINHNDNFINNTEFDCTIKHNDNILYQLGDFHYYDFWRNNRADRKFAHN